MIGLDVGSYSIKVIEAQKKDNQTAVSIFRILERSPEEPLAAAIKKALEGPDTVSRDLNISFGGSAVSMRVAELPEMEAEDLKNAARYEIERFSPFGIDAAVTDYQVLLKDPAAKKNMVLLAAAKADVVKNYINIISQAGFTVKAVDVNAAALTNAFLNAYPSRGNDPAQEAFILLNIGETASNMSIVHTAVPLVLRDIGIAGKEISEAISKSLDVDLREAYRLKHDPPGDKKEQIAEAARPVLSKLFKEIRLSIGYFENQFSKGISTIYLSGGSARFFGLSEFLNQSLEIQVELWNPFNSATTGAAVSVKALDAAKEELAIAFGLAIRDD